MISVKTFDDRYFPARQKRGLQPVCVPVRCQSQRFELKSQRFIKLAFIMVISAQSLNCSRSVRDWAVISNCVEQSFGFTSLALSIDSESVIINSYLPCSIYWQVHQYVAHFVKRLYITHDVGLLC